MKQKASTQLKIFHNIFFLLNTLISKSLFTVIVIIFICFSNKINAQSLELGRLFSFQAYTGTGAVTNDGFPFTGDTGTNYGVVSGTGLDPANGYNGTIYNNDATTIQARAYLIRVYIHLSAVFVTHPGTHAPSFGSGETITPGVYSIGGAGSIAGSLTLDGGGNADAVFIMKFEGALSIATSSTIILSNGTRAANVFWVAEGPISIGAQSVIKGNLLSHPGSISIGENSNIEGRLFSTEGSLVIGAGSVAAMPSGPSTIPVDCSAYCTGTSAVDVLGSIKNFVLFTSDGAVANTATSGFIGDIGTNTGPVSGFDNSSHVGSIYNTNAITSQAVQDLNYAYSELITIPNTELGHTPAFGSGETVFPGVYSISGAGSLAGTITLDAQNNPDAIFIFKFAGSLSAAAHSKVILSNGARRCNVFWIAEGAISLGAFSYMKGNFLSHGYPSSMEANGNLEGRMLSTSGAVTFSTGVVYNNTLCYDPTLAPNKFGVIF